MTVVVLFPKLPQRRAPSVTSATAELRRSIAMLDGARAHLDRHATALAESCAALAAVSDDLHAQIREAQDLEALANAIEVAVTAGDTAALGSLELRLRSLMARDEQARAQRFAAAAAD